MKLDILYEDNHLIVVYKPKGILSQSDSSERTDMLNILKDYIKEKYNKPGNVFVGLVHRLDINTDGIMVYAKTSKAAKRLSDQIQSHKFNKKYHTTVEGILNNKDYIKLENKLIKDEKIKKAFVNKEGKERILEYKALQSYKIDGFDVTDIDVKLLTGRFHQIRCQMANLGHPLLGDKKYGSAKSVDLYRLSCYYLSFYHPITNELKEFSLE